MMAPGGFDSTIEKWTASGDRDTATGPEPSELMALKVLAVIIPAADAAHATSAARYLQECLEGSVYQDVPASEQSPEDVRQWIIEVLAAHAGVPTA